MIQQLSTTGLGSSYLEVCALLYQSVLTLSGQACPVTLLDMMRTRTASYSSSTQSKLLKTASSSSSSSSSSSPIADINTLNAEPIIYDEKGPFQEFGEDESDSEDGNDGEGHNNDENDDDDDDDSGSDVSEGEDIYSLPLTLLEYSKAQQYIDRSNAESAVVKALTVILELYPHLLGMIKKARARGDGKVAPGSNVVKRNYADVRFLLSLVCIEIGRYREIDNDFEKAKERYQDALISFPKSVRISKRLKSQ